MCPAMAKGEMLPFAIEGQICDRHAKFHDVMDHSFLQVPLTCMRCSFDSLSQ